MAEPDKKTKAEEKKPAKRELSLYQHFLAGAISGGFETIAGHPLWVIKTRMQYNQPFTLNWRILSNGFIPELLSMGPTTALQMMLNYFFQSLFGNKQNLSIQFATSTFSGVISAIISCPMERIMTHQDKRKIDFLTALKYLTKNGGKQSLFVGLGSTGVREGIFFPCLATLSPLIKDKLHVKNDDLGSFMAGALSGCVSSFFTQPADIVKTKLQVLDPNEAAGTKDIIKNIYQNYGALGFLKAGLWPRMSRVAIGMGVIMTAHQRITTFLSSESPSNSGRKTLKS